MSLNFIYGRSGTGKSHYLYQEVVLRAKENPNKEIWMIVPEQFSFQAEKNLLLTQGTATLPNVRVFSFNRLTTEVLGRYGGITRQYLGKTGKNILVHLIIRKTGKKLKFLKKAISQRGFSQILCETFAELKRYRVEPLSLSEFSKGRENTLTGIKAYELSFLFQRYHELLHHRYLDNEDKMVEAALRMEQSGCLVDKEIWIDGFNGFTPIQQTMIETFMRHAPNVYLCFLTDCIDDVKSTRETDIFYPVKRQIQKFLDMAKKNQIKVYVRGMGTVNHRHIYCPELAHMEKNLFHGAIPFPGENNRVFVIEGINPQDEIAKIAARMITLAREQQYRWRDMALILPDIETYRHIIEAVFSRNSIHYFMDEKESLLRHPVAVFLLSVFEVLTGGFALKDIFRMLKTGMTGMEREDTDILENYCLANGIDGKKKWMVPFTRPFTEEEAGLEKVEALRKKVMIPLFRFREIFRDKTDMKAVCAAFFELMLQLEVPERLQRKIDALEKAKMLTQAGHYRQVWNVLMEMLDEMVELSQDEPVGLKAFSELLSTGLASLETGMIPASLDAVTIGNAQRTMLDSVKALFIVGAVDGVFPGGVDSGGFLSDGDRRQLLEAGIELAPDTRTHLFERQLEVYRMLVTPSKVLHISYPRSDPEGKGLRPAQLVKNIRAMFPECRDKDYESFLEQMTTPTAAFEELSVVLRKKKDGEGIDGGWECVYHWFDSQAQWKARVARILEGFNYTNQPKPLSGEVVNKAYGKDIYTSISRLEQFQMCPFSYFTRYCLSAEERKTSQWTEVDYGLLMHRVMERLLYRWHETGRGWDSVDTEWLNQNVPMLIDEVFEYTPAQKDFPAREAYFRETMQRVVRITADYVIGHITAGAFTPTGFELEFGMGGELPPMVLPLKGHRRLYLSGKIDRVDMAQMREQTYLRVVDYKSGAQRFSMEDLYYGLQIQLMAYASSVINRMDKGRRMINAGLLYVPLTLPVIRGDRDTTGEEMDERLRREMRMQGIVLQDDTVIKSMDKSLSPGTKSQVIPVTLKKDGTVDMRSAILPAEKLNRMEKHIVKLMQETGERILTGDIRIAPYRKKNETACRFCPYISICQFDSSLRDNRYRFLRPIKDEWLWKKIGENFGKSPHNETEKGKRSGKQTEGIQL